MLCCFFFFPWVLKIFSLFFIQDIRFWLFMILWEGTIASFDLLPQPYTKFRKVKANRYKHEIWKKILTETASV